MKVANMWFGRRRTHDNRQTKNKNEIGHNVCECKKPKRINYITTNRPIAYRQWWPLKATLKKKKQTNKTVAVAVRASSEPSGPHSHANRNETMQLACICDWFASNVWLPEVWRIVAVWMRPLSFLCVFLKCACAENILTRDISILMAFCSFRPPTVVRKKHRTSCWWFSGCAVERSICLAELCGSVK